MDNAVVLAEGVLGSTYGKTANGLVRFTKRYNVKAVIDSKKAGMDAGQVVEGKSRGIPVVENLSDSLKFGVSTLVVGIATDGGYLPDEYRGVISEALHNGLNVVSGLHEFISDDPEFYELARKHGVRIIDVRKMFRDMKMPFTGRIREVKSSRIAVLGTDSAIGKRTTTVVLTNSMRKAGDKSCMIGTGQTAWMQGIEHTVVVDSMINDFIPGNLEWNTLRAWDMEAPDIMFIEGQGSVLHPAYPGSFEIIGACRPTGIILQHAPKRKFFDGFEDFRIPPLEKYIKILELLSGSPVIAISVNRENMSDEEVRDAVSNLESQYGIPAFDPLSDDVERVSRIIREVAMQ
ncbi:MAG: DUF1611 domain-containing protein [Candidatus Thermoplasmatota archaeon]|jgi:uncharacterized NAD-dependent epimerase/dehydratase family protein|nr:DUF1611 domain-containing protein [Candidatus Thermoplasmatota archaeon]